MTAIGKVIQNLAEQLIQALDADPCVLSFTQHLNSKFPHYSHKKVSVLAEVTPLQHNILPSPLTLRCHGNTSSLPHRDTICLDSSSGIAAVVVAVPETAEVGSVQGDTGSDSFSCGHCNSDDGFVGFDAGLESWAYSHNNFDSGSVENDTDHE